MAHLITGYMGYEHIKSEDQGSFNAAFFGSGQFVMDIGNKFNAVATSTNSIRINDGDMLMQGRHIRINPNTFEDVIIQNGTSGASRIDLIVMTYTKDAVSGVEEAKLEVIKGTASSNPVAPAYTKGNILEGATKNQMPLYSVLLDGFNIAQITKMFTVIPTYKDLAESYAEEFQRACNSHLDSLNILDSLAEVMSNTSANQLASALAIKEIYSKMPTFTLSGDTLNISIP